MIAAAAGFALTVLSGAVAAQTQVKFKRGANTLYLTGHLSGYEQKRIFTIRVRRGQTMNIRDVGRNAVSVWVEGPPRSGYEQDLAADCHGRTDVSPTVAGVYRLTVTECRKVDRWRGPFRVKVTVR